MFKSKKLLKLRTVYNQRGNAETFYCWKAFEEKIKFILERYYYHEVVGISYEDYYTPIRVKLKIDSNIRGKRKTHRVMKEITFKEIDNFVNSMSERNNIKQFSFEDGMKRYEEIKGKDYWKNNFVKNYDRIKERNHENNL